MAILIKAARISSLRSALFEASQTKSISDCLIVLPEAFNIHGGYRDDPRPRPLDSSIPEALIRLSKEFRVAFVAGLIESRRQQQRYNCAYLIDNATWHLLCCKEQSDGTCNYDCCAANCNQPVSHRGLWIAALICLDAGTSEFSERGMQIRAGIAENEPKQAVLCIPAETLSINTEFTAQRWAANFHTLIANCNPLPPSVIHMKAASEPSLTQGDNNWIEIKDL